MNEDDITRLITSIDENDIEIIPSNDQLEFLPDHFIIENRNLNQPPIISIQTTRSIDEDNSEEFEDETFLERLYGLTEMFPNWLHRLFQNSNYFGQFIKKSIWFCSTSFIILILPILIQHEFSQVNEFQAAQTRQILLGPTAQIGVSTK